MTPYGISPMSTIARDNERFRVKSVLIILTSNIFCTTLSGKLEKGCCRHFVGMMPVVVIE